MDHHEIQSMLQDCKTRRIPVLISSNGLDIAFQTTIKQIEGKDLHLENMVKPEYISRFSAGTSFVLQVKMIRLQSAQLTPHGSQMIFAVHENSVIEETRQSERFMFTPEERVTAEFLNPHDSKTLIKRSVMDMSATGLSVRMNVKSKLFDAGTKLPDVRVAIDGKPYTKNAAEIVYTRKFIDLAGKLRVQAGLKFLSIQSKL